MIKENIEQIVNITNTDLDTIQLSLIDFEIDKISLELNPIVLNNNYKLESEFKSWDETYSEIKNNIRELNSKNADILNFNTPIELVNDDTSIRLFVTKILTAGNVIAGEGRIGNANFYIMNSKIYELIKNKFIHPVIIDDTLEDEVIIGRKNEIDMPGISLAINSNNKYIIIKSGLAPEKQYRIIKYNLL